MLLEISKKKYINDDTNNIKFKNGSVIGDENSPQTGGVLDEEAA